MEMVSQAVNTRINNIKRLLRSDYLASSTERRSRPPLLASLMAWYRTVFVPYFCISIIQGRRELMREKVVSLPDTSQLKVTVEFTAVQLVPYLREENLDLFRHPWLRIAEFGE